MYLCFRASLVLLLLTPVAPILAQVENPLALNGVLYEQMPDAADEPQPAFLWALELQEPSDSYELVVNSDQRKRASIVFFQQVSGRDWKKYWNQRMGMVYSSNLQMVNDHAEAFFGITGGFPDTFKAGDRFSLEASADQATRAYLNDKQIAQSFKSGHFEFWLRAWQTGLVMPQQFSGNLLAGGRVSEDLEEAFLTSQPPESVDLETPAGDSMSEQQLVESRSGDERVTATTETVVSPAVMPVYVGGQNQAGGF